MNILNEVFKNERECLNYLSSLKGEPICCGKIYKYKNGNFKCSQCLRVFNVRTGTIFERSRIPLMKWFMAVYLVANSTKGLSSIQLSTMLGITQKSAWFMLQRIRNGLGEDFKLKGTVEVDETYVGGRFKNKVKKPKIPVLGLCERKGRIKTRVIPTPDKYNLYKGIRENVRKGSRIITDEHPSYRGIDYPHETINHSATYVEGDVHTNGIEGFWSHLKRGLRGIYIHTSKKHLQKYCDEYTFRYNRRHLSPQEKFDQMLLACNKYISYKELIGK